MSLRRLHAYLSLFVAPSILFFALTGALQLFRLHEPHGSYRPPLLIEKLGRLHQAQVFAPRRATAIPVATAAAPASAPVPPQHGRPPSPATEILKWFFLFVSAALAATAGLGLWLGLRRPRRPWLAWLLLALGTAVPVALAAGSIPG